MYVWNRIATAVADREGSAPDGSTIDAEGTDEQLVRAARAGDADCFGLLYRRYHKRTFSLAYGMTGRADRAEDLTQEIFARVYEQLENFDGRAEFATWFYRLAVNCALNYCRRERWWRRASASLDDAEALSVESGDARTDDRLQSEQVQARVRKALASLKPQARVLVVLREIEGMSYDEIAERLECSPGSVASGLSRARLLLARKLESMRGTF